MYIKVTNNLVFFELNKNILVNQTLFTKNNKKYG